MTPPPLSEWLNELLLALQWLQNLVLLAWYWLTGQTTDFGQPAWPLEHRVAAEVLRIDHPLARQVLYSLIGAPLLLLTLIVALCWRRLRWWLLAGFVLGVGLIPWPTPELVFTTAYPSSFHQSPTLFAADSIVRGRTLYQQNCLSCHGADGSGQGERASSLSRWPPHLASPLLGRKADGELAWHILHGMQDHRGQPTMPGFAGQISPDDVWALLDYMKALGAGTGVQQQGLWPIPLALPDFTVQCENQPPQPLHQMRNRQRVRLIAAGSEADANWLEDPRLLTIMLTPDADTQRHPQMQCWSDSRAAWDSLALMAGVAENAFAGVQFLADRQGWLRARSLDIWSDSDFLCTSTSDTDGAPAAASPRPADGLGELIDRMDAEPVRYVKGGFAH